MNGKEFKELINRLVDDNDIIIISSDGEGNTYEEFGGHVDANALWIEKHGEVKPYCLTDKLKDRGYTEDDLYDGDDGKKAFVLYP
jgi:hypothetical protein